MFTELGQSVFHNHWQRP